jgi:hypothetical protein
MAVLSPAEVQNKNDRQRCLTDKQFLSEVLGYDFVPAVHEPLWNQFFKYDSEKPWASQSDIAKILILWPRGHFKTTAVIVDIIQAILNFPDIRILIMRGSIKITQAWLGEIKAHFTGRNPNSRLASLFPEFCAPLELDNATAFTIAARRNKGLAQATVTVASPKSVKTGTHYDIGFFDDMVNDQNYRSPTLLKKIQQDFFACMPLIDPPFFAIMTGTRYSFGDVYENITTANIKSGEWRISFRTCWTDDTQTVPLFPQQPAIDRPWIDEQGIGHMGGKLVGFTKEMLDLMRDSDPEMFASQYMNQPIRKGGQRFTRAFLESCLVKPQLYTSAPLVQTIIFEKPDPTKPALIPLSPSVLFLDLANTDGEESDDSCILVGKHDQNMTQYVVNVTGGKWLSPMLAEQTILAAILYRPEKIFIEKSAAGIVFVDYLRLVALQRKMVLPVEFIKVDNQKDAKYIRIANLQGLMSYKRLQFFEGIPVWDKIVHQFEIFPGGKHKHDDYIDTIALFATHMIGTKMAMQPVQPKRNPLAEMIRQAEVNNALLMAKEIAERAELRVTDGFTEFNDGFDAY